MSDEPADPLVCPCCGANAAKLRLVADWFDSCYPFPSQNREVQEDLNAWADAITGEE